MAKRPVFSELSAAECLAVLERNDVGRVAFTFHDRVDIEPVSYAFADGWVYGRTSAGTKLVTVLHHPWVAFEVDEIEGRYDWRSVVVHGGLYVLQPAAGDRDREAYTQALGAIRRLEAEALTENDPAPHRTVVFGVQADNVSGRAAATKR
jgi:hypothetical protein